MADETGDLFVDDDLPPEEELAQLAQETLEHQTDTRNTEKIRQRCQRVITLFQQHAIQSSRDYFHAALVLIYGERTEHYRTALDFARTAANLGEPRAWSLVAMSWDRWLLSMGKAQRFGTQIVKQAGQWSLREVDPAITDYERALYTVPPLFVQQKRVKQLQHQEDQDDF